MWLLAFRNVLRHKARTGMTLLAIIAGVVGLILSGGFVHDIFTQLGEVLIHSQSGHLQVTKPGYFERGARSPEKFLIQDSEELSQKIAQTEGVDDVMGRLYFVGLINNGRTDLPILGEGIEQIAKKLERQGVLVYFFRQCDEQRRLRHRAGGDAVQLRLIGVQPGEPLCGRGIAFVGNVVGAAGETVDRLDRPAQMRRNEEGGNGKVLVVIDGHRPRSIG